MMEENNKSKQGIKGLVIGLLLVLVGIGIIVWILNKPAAQPAQDSAQDSSQTQNSGLVEVSDDGTIIGYEGVTGKTALELLKEAVDVETSESEYGEFVTTIDGVKADEKSEYWAFYVNGTLSNEGAGTYQTKDGEEIQWKLEKF